MKNVILCLCLCCVASLCILSCGKGTIPVATSLVSTRNDTPQDTPRLWKQVYFANFSISQIDSIRFITIDSIKFKGNTQFEIIDGKVVEIDTVIIVPPQTLGQMVNLSKKPGEKERTTALDILFENDTRTVPFVINKDGTFSVKGIQGNQLYWYLKRIPIVRVLAGVQPQ